MSLLLQKISDQLQPNQKLIIAIDALDAVEHNSQLPGSNIFYLPRYLPEKIYLILTRRPYSREKSGLLIETPSQILDLSELPEKNSQDLYRYIQTYLTSNLAQVQRTGEREQSLKSWLSCHNIHEEEFCDRLTIESENNFMYLSQIFSAIVEGFYPEPWQRYQLPSGLETYYQQHWQKMTAGGLSDIALKVLRVLTSTEQAEGISIAIAKRSSTLGQIAQTLNEDEYEIEEVLENWFEFLQQQRIGEEIHYSFYHSSFGNWLAKLNE
ncbi:MAG: hypothetical protein H0X31_07475 [Nostocaceae cyanobacterium]|nr:hypothetical protein [Nostocaceae cyanobacterium]